MTIDSHQHFWNYELPKHDWIDDDMSAIRRDFTPSDLAPVLARNGVDGCVAVQADQTTVETDFLLDVAERHDFVKGVVGWIDLRAEDIKARLDRYDGKAHLKGWRHVVQGEPDPYFLLQADFLRGIGAIGKRGYTYDILIFPHQLVTALELVKLFPDQRFVIDHLAKPYLKDGYHDGWAAAIAAFSPYENVSCKISGLVTEGDYEAWTEASLQPYFDTLFEVFPTDRLMFGSDWPVCRVATTYDRWIEIVRRAVTQRAPEALDAIMGENCARFYGL